MWVVYQDRGDSTVFANDGWRETRLIGEAERFAKQSDAVNCAVGMRMQHGGKWFAARWKDAVRW